MAVHRGLVFVWGLDTAEIRRLKAADGWSRGRSGMQREFGKGNTIFIPSNSSTFPRGGRGHPHPSKDLGWQPDPWQCKEQGHRQQSSSTAKNPHLQLPPPSSSPERRCPAATCIQPCVEGPGSSLPSAWRFSACRPGSAALASSGRSASPAPGRPGAPALATASAWTASTAPAPASAEQGLSARPARAAPRASTAATAIKVPSAPAPRL